MNIDTAPVATAVAMVNTDHQPTATEYIGRAP